MRRHARTLRSRAFTLIELLVVVAIIALLIAILLPSMNKSRRKAREAACASNCRQLAMATNLYNTEMTTVCPPYLQSDSDGGSTLWAFHQPPMTGSMTFTGYLSPYLKDYKVLTCPEAFPAQYAPIIKNGYQINYSMGALTAVNSPLTVASQITSPVDTVAFAESLNISGVTVPTNVLQIYRPSSVTTQYFHGIHGDGIGNVSFYDGHVEAIPVQLVPPSAMPYSVSAADQARAQTYKVGMLCYGQINPAKTTAYSVWHSYAQYSVDRYFWLDKSTPTN